LIGTWDGVGRFRGLAEAHFARLYWIRYQSY